MLGSRAESIRRVGEVAFICDSFLTISYICLIIFFAPFNFFVYRKWLVFYGMMKYLLLLVSTILTLNNTYLLGTVSMIFMVSPFYGL